MKVRCKRCNKEYNAKPSQIRRGFKKYCSRICSSLDKRTGEHVICENCGKKFYKCEGYIKRSSKHFCSKSCSAIWKNERYSGDKHPQWKGGKYSYRDRALKHYVKKCQNANCPFDKVEEFMLDVHHKDGG